MHNTEFVYINATEPYLSNRTLKYFFMKINTLFIFSCIVLLGCNQNEKTLKPDILPSKMEGFSPDSSIVNSSIVTQKENIIEREQPNLNKQPSDYQIDGYLIPLEGIQEVYELIEELDSVELKFQFETSLSISNEGPHCDLKSWNKGFSEWVDISHRIEEKGYFRCYWQTTIDTAYYPKMNLEEIKSYVKNNCDSYWYELIKDFDSINPFYINVGASMYNFKVRGKNPVTNEEIEKIFSLPIPMGC
jgi:hypothetical protein